MRISFSDLSLKFAPPGKVITGVAVDGCSLVCEVADAPDTRHKFKPHKKYPQFCECGYAEHETLKHLPRS